MKNSAWLLSAFLMVAGPSMAQDALVRDFRVIRACAGDVERLCPGVLPGEGRIKACMKENMSKLSADCVDTMLTAASTARETAQTKPVPIPANPKSMTYTDLRGVIYCEVWLFRNDPSGQMLGVYYNTSALNNSADKKNTCPAAMWDKVTVPWLEANFDILAVYRNGPRGWTMDSIALPVGPMVAFNGLETRWMGQGLMPKGVSLASAHMAPYTRS